MNAYKRIPCKNIAKRLVCRELEDLAAAEKFYQRKVALDVFNKPGVEFYGEEDGFKEDEGILMELGDWLVRKDSEGKEVNLLNGLRIFGMAKTYDWELDDYTPILLLSDLLVEGNYARTRITLNPERAKYILIMESLCCSYHKKPPKLSRQVRRDPRLLFNATRVAERHVQGHSQSRYIHYRIYPYIYPYENHDLEPIVTSYRNQLYEQYLEQAFMLVD